MKFKICMYTYSQRNKNTLNRTYINIDVSFITNTFVELTTCHDKIMINQIINTYRHWRKFKMTKNV